MIQWLRLHASNAGGMDLIPAWGTKILHATWHGQNKKNVEWGDGKWEGSSLINFVSSSNGMFDLEL